MKLKRIVLIAGMFFIFTVQIFSQVIVKADIDSREYKVGDIIKVLINVEKNPGLHTLFFDLEYDESILSFEGKRDSRIFGQTTYPSEILYARNTLSQGFSTCRIVFSYSLKGAGTEIKSDGSLVELSFRVINGSSESHSFIFSNCKVIDGDDNEIAVSFQNSPVFTIKQQAVTEFILIKKPYENEVFYTDTTFLSLICTEGEDYLVKLSNNRITGVPAEFIEVTNGRLLNQEVAVAEGINKLTAELYTADPSGGTAHEFKTLDTVRMYKSAETEFVEIIDPADHSLLNTDMVTVRALTPFNYVEINGRMANFYGETQGDAKVFESTVWLKSGFNTITAVTRKDNPDNILYHNSTSDSLGETWLTDNSASWVTNEFTGTYLEIDGFFASITGNTQTTLTLDAGNSDIDFTGTGYAYRIRSSKETEEDAEIKFTDSIQVYYQKDSSIFGFVKPYENQGFKPSIYNKLEILGEIDSKYKTTDDPATGGAVENTVTLKVIYYPSNSIKKPVILADREALITESDYGYSMTRSKYVFKNNFEIPLLDLEEGKIEIIAYKNKAGDTWDDRIVRTVYIDDSRLWIDLVQPNVYTSDVLDTKSKIKNFNESREITCTPEESILITNQGKICLNTTNPVVHKENIGNVNQIIEAPDKTLYALVTPSKSSMVIYKKAPGDENWSVFLSKTGIYGYSICYSKIGLLAGVSNIPANGKSGLYLVKENQLVEFEFTGVNLPHVQFVSSRENTIYLYGSLYNSLYLFHIYNLSENNGKYRVLGLKEEFFPNNDNILQFILSDNERTAVVRTDESEGNIHFYRRSDSGFTEVTMPELNDVAGITGKRVIHGPYKTSDYSSYLIFTSGTEGEVIMENNYSGKFFRRGINFQTIFGSSGPVSVLGAGFRDSQYTFIFESAGSYYLSSGELFFNNYYGQGILDALLFSSTQTITKSAEELFITGNENYYLGLQSASSKELFNFYNQYAAAGSIGFNYVNDDVDRLTGFGFEIDSLWQEAGSSLEYIPGIIDFGFSVKEKEPGEDTTGTEETVFYLAQSDMSDIIKLIDAGEGKKYTSPDQGFTISRSYNSYTAREILYIEFSEDHMPECGYIHFDFELSALGNTSPGIHSLEVFKKIITKIAKSPGETMYLPVQGYVYDTTVTEIKIGNAQVPVGRDGSFYYVKSIDSSIPAATVYLSCRNVVGEEAELDFTVEIVESENEVWDVFCDYGGGSKALVPDEITGDFHFNTGLMEIIVSGKYFGLAGAVCGYETYSIEDTGFESPLNNGVFTTIVDFSVYTGPALGTGYEAGYFVDEPVKLAPNDQVLIIYVENPGGIRYEYKSDAGEFPVFNYQMPEEDQMVVFDAEYEIDETINDIHYTHRTQTPAVESPAPPYVFTAQSAIKGEVLTIEQLDEVRVLCSTPGLVFGNGENEMTVALKAGNKFQIPFSVVMVNDEIEKDFYVAVKPVIPVYSFMRRGIIITVKKDFSNTSFIPDFSSTTPENTEPVQIKFLFKDRTDIPLDNRILATFIVNFSEVNTTGYVDAMDNEFYCLRDTETGVPLNLDNLKIGTNRIQWTFQFLDRDKDTGEVKNTILMSSSSFAGMNDIIFTITDVAPAADTNVEFSTPLENTYYSLVNPVPSIIITKDPLTDCFLTLNDTQIEAFTGEQTSITYTLGAQSIKEGRNSLVIFAIDKNNSQSTFSYTFLYDSKNPAVHFYSWQVSSDYSRLSEVTAIVKEANYHRGYLHYGNSIINVEPVVTLLGEDTCLLAWKNLTEPVDYDIRPGTEPVTISVLDLAGNTGVTPGNLDAFLDIERPAEQTIKETQIQLPIYDAAIDDQTGKAPPGSPDPVPYNEINYKKRPFGDHTKFAPHMLMGQVDVQDELDEDGWLVSNNKVQKMIPGQSADDDNYGNSISVSGDVAIVGANMDDDGGDKAGAVYVYRRNGDIWEIEQKLTAGIAGECFGRSVSISGDVIAVGSFGVTDGQGYGTGAAYIYRWNGTEWALEQSIPSPPSIEHYGRAISVNGSNLIVGSGSHSPGKYDVFIYRWNGTVWEFEQTIHAPEYGFFGYIIDISGDVVIIGNNVDGYPDNGPGAAYIYHWNGISWELQVKLSPTPGLDGLVNGDQFGCSVSVLDDIIVVGSENDDDAGSNAGAVYIFKWNGTEWVLEDKLLPEYSTDGSFVSDLFGNSVDIVGDIIVIGASHDDDAGDSTGAAYVYQWNESQWEYTNKLIPQYGVDSIFNTDFFGSVVCTGEDFILIGSDYDDDGGTNVGAVYFYPVQENMNPTSLDTSLPFDSHEKSYLVFQVEKNAICDLTAIEDLQGLINFEVSGFKQDLSSSFDVIPVYPAGLTDHLLDLTQEGNSRYIEGLQYLYYIVDIENLKIEFETAAGSMWMGLPTEVPVDRGSLKLIYSDPLDDIPPYRVYVTGTAEDAIDDIIVFDKAYEGEPSGDMVLVHEMFQHTLENVTVPVEEETAGMSLSFWIRVEDEGIMDDNFANTDRRIVTFNDGLGEELYYLSYEKGDGQILVDIVDLTMGSASRLIGDDKTIPLFVEAAAGVRNDCWNHIVLRFTKDDTSGYMNIIVNDHEVYNATITLDLNFYNRIIAPGAVYYFGPDFSDPLIGDEVTSAGFYSIAHPFYINRLLTNDEIARLTSLFNYTSGGDSEYYFNTAQYDFGNGENDLTQIGSSDYSAPGFNAGYNVGEECEAFKASSSFPNYFKKAVHPGGGEYVIFKDADGSVQYNVSVTGGTENFTVELAGTAEVGRYYFGNKNSNYGLRPNRWYSISGEIVSLETGAQARLVMKLNGNEQSLSLKPGKFHFIYDNPSEAAPAEVRVYIETTGDITIDTMLKCNEGNFIVPSGMDNKGYALSAASTTFVFDYSGTVDLWYKPFITNSRGYINYDVVLFDSEYIKIEASAPGYDESEFRASIKNESGDDIVLSSCVKVDYDWHHLQVSYNHASKIVYFYIDGKTADIYEGTALPESETIKGNIGRLDAYGDNVFIGCNEDKSIFAEGYLDNVRISKYFYYSRYSDITPVTISYIVDEQNSANNRLDLDTLTFDIQDITDASYKLIATNGSYVSNSISLPFYTSVLPAGRYQLISEMKAGGYAYHHYLTFNVDNKPRFNLVDKTPLIFANVKTDVYFAFEYDNSYIFETDELKYAGAAIRINGNKIRYLVQDFINQDTSSWLLGSSDGGSGITWTPIEKDNGGRLFVVFLATESGSSIPCEYEYFYFTEMFNPALVNTYGDGNAEDKTIYKAELTEVTLETKTYDIGGVTEEFEYMIHVEIAGDASSTSDIIKDIVIEYTIQKAGAPGVAGSGRYSLNKGLSGNFYVDIYYDDILPDYGTYNCTLKLKYNDIPYEQSNKILVWKQLLTIQVETEKSLEIEEFSLLELDKKNNKASFYLQYYNNGVSSLTGELAIKRGNNLDTSTIAGLSTMNATGWVFIQNKDIPQGYFTVTVKIEADGFIRTRELELANFKNAPDIVLTNGVESVISYNDVYFSWKGYLDGSFNESIEYCYDFDGSNWSSWSGDWRDVRFYNLCEGYHYFKVKARNPDGSAESIPEIVNFFVDINKPVFDPELIEIIKLYDSLGICSGAAIRGKKGAIMDASLDSVAVDSGQKVTRGENGSFEISNIPVTNDGITPVIITAMDRVGNYTDYTINVENNITTVIFPDVTEYVKYSPLTIAGTIDKSITAGVDIYLLDPFCPEQSEGSYEGWKKGKVNQDRTFFIENVFANPGTKDQGIVTTLKLACVFENGKVFEKELEIWANEIILPIELSLSRHSAEGENADTEVTIAAHANVVNISSWSVDFDGDGIYDAIDIVDITTDPEDDTSKYRSWTHTYSTIGLVHPRVRVITTDGNFFSMSDTLIIHEKIKEVSHKMVDAPVSMDSVRMNDDSQRIFLLKGWGQTTAIDVYEVARNENYISNKKFTINLDAMGIDGAENTEDLGIKGPVCIRVIDEDHLVIAANSETTGALYELAANEFDNYQIVRYAELTGFINDMSLDEYKLYISYSNRNYFTTITMEEKLIDISAIEDKVPEIYNTVPIGENSGIAKDSMGLLVADFFNQRIIRLTNGLQMHEQFGIIGAGEKEFLTPSIITSYGNRIFVFDQTRCDIQVFDLTYTPVCTLTYSEQPGYYNYMESTFFNDVRDISVISRIENNMLYYYALIASKSAGKLALLRLPQWEELRARVRNNKIVFIRDGEVFTAKPDGSDLRKILCTDSIPRVEGALNYPSLSPDGRKLVFTSRLDLYVGAYDEIKATGSGYAYDHIYLYNIEDITLERLYLGEQEGYEIERPVFNSNGDTLIFSAKETGGKWQIYAYGIDSSVTAQLFTADENARFPYYSPEDDYVVFTTDYDGDEDIVITSVDNPDIRIKVTNNNERDTFPVWVSTYPDEEDSADYVDSKIAYVSEHLNHQKGIYYVFIQHIPDFGLNIVDSAGQNVGDNPDSAAIPITDGTEEGDYPCFTGDGKNIVFERYNGEIQKLRNYDFIEPAGSPEKITDMNLPEGSERPAGMKNMITNFKAENIAGNQVKLTWDRYTDSDIYYVVEIDDEDDSEPSMNRDVLSQDGTVIKGLKTGTDYRFRVYISENDEEAATSRVEYVSIPVVTAIPAFEIDEENPYVVHLHAWKPEDSNGDTWRFSWIINNTEILVQNSRDFSYEFGTRGRKTIQLKVYDSLDVGDANNYDISEPFYVDIVSDIVPVIEYVLAEDSSYIDLTCVNSLGYNIDFASAIWSITGPDGSPVQLTGPAVTVDISGFNQKINVNLTLPRIPVNGQQAADMIVKTRVIDLDYTDLKPVITCQEHETKERLIKFSGQESIGNIDWYRARWSIFADNSVIYQTEGVSTFDYLFPERNSDTVYSVSLTIPRRSDGLTDTISQIISIEAAPIEPVIDYEILSITKDDDVIGQKIIFDCTKSTGSGIEFSQARWSVPLASDYGNQAIQIGPTATYNLVGIEEGIVVEVALTLSRAGGTDAKTVSQLISIKNGEIPAKKLVINRCIEDSTDGKVLILDVLDSTGPNIDWERTDWLIDGQYTRKGPVMRYDIPASADGTIITYTCVLYRFGGEPETKTDQVTLGKASISPLITSVVISHPNVYELSVKDTRGINIDWEKTRWFIYDGNQDVVVKQGAIIHHAFVLDSEQMGYPVMVEMFLKGDTKPFTAITPIDVLGDELIPVITYFRENVEGEDTPNKIMLSAETSQGSGIDWSQTKWTFLDTAEVAYGPVISHTFPRHSSQDKIYTVALTLYRRKANGDVESKTGSREIDVGSDEIVPKIKVQVFGDYLVLSAEESAGYGLLLDRCTWLFPGEGDSYGRTDSSKYGVIEEHGWNIGGRIGTEVTLFKIWKLYAEASGGYYQKWTDYSDYEEENDSFSTQNSHTGPVCRRYIRNKDGELLTNQIVTLFVYRMTADGGAEGKSITVNIDLENVKASSEAQADSEGVIYE